MMIKYFSLVFSMAMIGQANSLRGGQPQRNLKPEPKGGTDEETPDATCFLTGETCCQKREKGNLVSYCDGNLPCDDGVCGSSAPAASVMPFCYNENDNTACEALAAGQDVGYVTGFSDGDCVDPSYPTFGSCQRRCSTANNYDPVNEFSCEGTDPVCGLFGPSCCTTNAAYADSTTYCY